MNKAYPVGNSPWDLFKPAPNETQLLIHSFPLAFLASDDAQLFPSLHQSICNARGVSILLARYFNPDPESRENKSATSVVVTMAPPDAYAILPSINLFSQNPNVEQMFSSSKNSQCKTCWKFGHISTHCPSSLPGCPFCSLTHTKAEHRCPNPSCPEGGNLRPVLACCPSSVACCPNCQEEHSARSNDCPSRPKATPEAPELRPRQTQDSMDLAEDTRLALRRSFAQHQVPRPEPRVPLYSRAMLLHLGREPNGPSPSLISPQERAVMNL